MKKKVLFSIALAGLMLGSCSKDAIDNGGNGASWNENGEGYISLSLNLPSTTNGSRVGEEGSGTSFDDGEGNEYAVKDAVLVLFSGTEDDETKVEFNSAYKMNLGNWENNSSDQITTSAKIVQKINEIEEDNIYALVVLNSNGVLNVTEDAKLKIGSSAEAFSGNLEALNTAVTALTNETDKTWSETGFLMSNSPLFTTGGGNTMPTGTEVKTLVKIATANIYDTEEEAIANPAANIYVERAQAKVQVVDKTTDKNTFTITDKTGATVTYKYTIGNWDIDNFNVKSSLTRNFDPTWAPYQNANNSFYRFVDAKEVETNAGLYRTYWGKDVNYDAITEATDIKLSAVEKTTGEIPTLTKAPGAFTYCFENTTDVVPATGKDLTRVIISANLVKGQDGTAADFFVVNDDRSTIYLNDGTNEGAGSIQQRIKEYVLNLQSVQEAINKNVTDPKSFDGNDFTVSLNLPEQSGILNNNIITVAVKDDSDVSFKEDETTSKEAIKNAIETGLQNATNDFKINYYKGGVCYYQAFIRHFTESECPWTEGNEQTDTNTTKYLGRYGVLRNNWYVLNVNSIKQIGDSTYPVVPTYPVDEEEFYLSVDINILAWAKRAQEVDL